MCSKSNWEGKELDNIQFGDKLAMGDSKINATTYQIIMEGK